LMCECVGGISLSLRCGSWMYKMTWLMVYLGSFMAPFRATHRLVCAQRVRVLKELPDRASFMRLLPRLGTATLFPAPSRTASSWRWSPFALSRACGALVRSPIWLSHYSQICRPPATKVMMRGHAPSALRSSVTQPLAEAARTTSVSAAFPSAHAQASASVPSAVRPS
jgi:hypothetical protein